METIDDTVDEHLEVRSEITLNGMASKGITVLDGGFLHLNGMCVGDLGITGTGYALVHGMVIGDVVNDAEVEIFGTVRGKVIGPGKTVVDDNAVIIGGVE